MKKIFYLLFVLPFIASCAHYPDGTSVWAEGTWLVPAIPLIGAFFFFRASYISWKGGWEQLKPSGEYTTGKEKLPFWKNQYGFLTYGIACLIVAGFIIANVISNK